MMNYNRLKWTILIFPPVMIGLWEFIRHEYLEHVIPTGFGNGLASLLVFLALIAITSRLFANMEKSVRQLQRERTLKAQLEEREQIARTLHDGIAQSLFLLSVKLENKKIEEAQTILHEVNTYVRESIAQLRLPVQAVPESWQTYFAEKALAMARDNKINFKYAWEIPQANLSPQETTQLVQIISECLQNTQKHARAQHVRLSGTVDAGGGWTIEIEDDGVGFARSGSGATTHGSQDFEEEKKFGIMMMQQRCRTMNWQFHIASDEHLTTIRVRKEGAGEHRYD